MRKSIFFLSPQNLYLFPLLFLFLLSGCEKEAVPEDDVFLNQKARDKSEKVNTFYGPAVPFSNGVTRAMVTMNHAGEPVAIGVKISEKVMEGLPEEHKILTLRLPNKAAGMAFDHIDLDWNPEGHEPEFYGTPHFDVHFYMIPVEEKMQITDLDKAADLPDSEYLPETYFTPHPVEMVPYMGVHWLDANAPELPPHGEEFTHTFIYGSYDDRVIFMEPMITLDYLLKEADGTPFPIAQPEKFKISGSYPTWYSMDYDPRKKEYIILLSGMKQY